MAEPHPTSASRSRRVPARTILYFPDKEGFAEQYEEFVRFGATPFPDEDLQITAPYWLEQCEYAFREMPLTSNDRVHLAVFQLRSYARDWWHAIKETLDINTLTWGAFRKYFQEEYVPKANLADIQERLKTLQQGTMTFREYYLKFKSLTSYAPRVFETEQNKIETFIQGLRPELKGGLTINNHDSFVRMTASALRLEAALGQHRKQPKGEKEKRRDVWGNSWRNIVPIEQELHLKPMETPAEKYAQFQDGVKRTVYIDNLSPKVTEPVLRTALGQFGTVVSVQFVPNYIEAKLPQCALVEMQNAKQANSIVAEMECCPFMMSGMPRPVRAFAAEPRMFVDRPPEPARKIKCKWMDPKDPDFAVAKEIKNLTRKHRAEASYLLTLQLEEEAKLHKQQEDSLKANYKKFEMIDKLQGDGTLAKLGKRMNIRITDD